MNFKPLTAINACGQAVRNAALAWLLISDEDFPKKCIYFFRKYHTISFILIPNSTHFLPPYAGFLIVLIETMKYEAKYWKTLFIYMHMNKILI